MMAFLTYGLGKHTLTGKKVYIIGSFSYLLEHLFVWLGFSE